MAQQHLRGPELLSRWQLERFPFLKARKSDDPVRFLQSEFTSARFPAWAPRDVDSFSATYAEFAEKGFARLEVPLSLVGHGGRPNHPAPVEVSSNSFTRAQYSYFHLSFDRLAEFVRTLRPEDRFVAFLLSEDERATHVYFDIDASTAQFPDFAARQEQYVAQFVRFLAEFFQQTFQRPMDLRGLMLLQASNASKVSWHVHVQSEAFASVKELKAFVARFREYIETRPASSIQMCVKEGSGGFTHVVDLAPFGSNQNFRCPYNQKPGKSPLRLRTHCWHGDNVLGFTPQSDPGPEVIDPEVLFRAHPNLALPTRPGYVLLVTPPDPRQTKLLVKRKLSSVTTASQASVAAGGFVVDRTKNLGEHETRLSSEELKAVHAALAPDLGQSFEFYKVFRYTRESVVVIRGSCQQKSANCVHLSRVRKQAVQHSSNRMRFELAAGVLKYFCYKDSCPPVYTDWACSDANNKLINPDYTAPASAASSPVAACSPASPQPLESHPLLRNPAFW
jgi:hypothetical protein